MENISVFVVTILVLAIPGQCVLIDAFGNNSTEDQKIFNQSESEMINAHFYPDMENTTETSQILTNQILKGENLTDSKSMTIVENSSISSIGNTSHQSHNNDKSEEKDIHFDRLLNITTVTTNQTLLTKAKLEQSGNSISEQHNTTLPDNSHMFINSCPPFYYPCNDNKTCIPSELLCNDVFECPDNSDEYEVCQAREKEVVLCNNGQILKGYNIICNGIIECTDGSDETGCEALAQDSCESHGLFSCRDDSDTCLHHSLRCDSTSDCQNELDEHPVLCNFKPTVQLKFSYSYTQTVIVYKHHQKCDFQCDVGKRCLSYKKKCDGNTDCWDGTDEMDCGQETSPDKANKNIYTHTVPIIALCVVALSLLILLISAVYFGVKKRRQIKSRGKREEIKNKITSYHNLELETPPAYEERTNNHAP